MLDEFFALLHQLHTDPMFHFWLFHRISHMQFHKCVKRFVGLNFPNSRWQFLRLQCDRAICNFCFLFSFGFNCIDLHNSQKSYFFIRLVLDFTWAGRFSTIGHDFRLFFAVARTARDKQLIKAPQLHRLHKKTDTKKKTQPKIIYQFFLNLFLS